MIRTAGCILIMMLAAAPASAAERIACPPELHVQPREVASVPQGWSAWIDAVNTHHYLKQVSLYDGEPKELASLVPDLNDKKNAVWTLTSNQRGYYLACAYEGSSVQLYRRVPEGTKACRVSFEEGISQVGGGASIQSATCE
jgi:hypothetical protein